MFIAYNTSLELIRSLRQVVPQIQRHDSDLAKQMRRAVSSVSLNLNEGRKRVGQDRLHFYRMADASASEVLAGLDVADAWGGSTDASAARGHLDHLMAMLWNLTPCGRATRVRRIADAHVCVSQCVRPQSKRFM